MDKRQLTCINCPMGCQLLVEIEDSKVMSLSGNLCKRGEVYAKEEISNPTRTVTSTVKVTDGDKPFIAVKTKEPIPKEKIFECMQALKKVSVQAPVEIGDIILKNVADTGIDIVATMQATC